MPLAPIWKDRKVTLASAATYADFEVRRDNDSGPLVYAGRAYARPNEATVYTRINDICADYIAAVLPRLTQGVTSMQSAATFVVLVGGVTKDTVTFYNDWSYDDTFNPETMDLADPVNGILDPRQYLFYSVLPGTSSVSAVVTFSDNTTATIALTIYSGGDFNGDFSNDFYIAAAGAGGTAVLDLHAVATTYGKAIKSVQIGTTTYTVTDRCRAYAAYYVNQFGGWDALVLDGFDTQRDDLVRYSNAVDYDNAESSARGRKDYAIEVTPAWVLRTGFLTDEQSRKMTNLLNSTEVYLCELLTGKFSPVLLTDTTSDKKSYTGNGRRPNNYTFNAILAQQRFRR